MPAMWSTSVRNPGYVTIFDPCNCVAAHTETAHTHTFTHTPQEAGVRVNSAAGMMGAHMLSSHDENRVKGTISPGGRGREIKVHSLMLE